MDSLLSEIDITAAAYADDFKVMGNLAHYNYHQVQDQVSRVYEWSMKMRMPNKCLVVHYGQKNPRL